LAQMGCVLPGLIAFTSAHHIFLTRTTSWSEGDKLGKEGGLEAPIVAVRPSYRG